MRGAFSQLEQNVASIIKQANNFTNDTLKTSVDLLESSAVDVEEDNDDEEELEMINENDYGEEDELITVDDVKQKLGGLLD